MFVDPFQSSSEGREATATLGISEKANFSHPHLKKGNRFLSVTLFYGLFRIPNDEQRP
jgi:hypothetical protein